MEEHHGDIRIGFLNNDPAIFSRDEATEKFTGMLAEYISYAKDCLGNQTLKFKIEDYNDYDEMLQALQDHEIDMIFYAGRNPDFAEKKGYTLTNTAWTYSLMSVTDEGDFDEHNVYTVAVPKEKEALKQYIAFSYPQWKLVDYDSLEDAADMVTNDKADGFLMGASQALIYDNDQDFKSVPLTNTMEAEIPIIAMTANAFAEDRKRALDAGMNEHIAKPIDIEKMRAVILSVLNKQEN